MSKKSGISDERLALYDKLIETNPEIKRKGDKMPYTSLNGHMFSFLSETGSLALRLPKQEHENFCGKYHTEPVIAYGAVLKEYAAVPDKLFENTAELKQYFDISYEYVKSLKPKPTKKKK